MYHFTWKPGVDLCMCTYYAECTSYCSNLISKNKSKYRLCRIRYVSKSRPHTEVSISFLTEIIHGSIKVKSIKILKYLQMDVNWGTWKSLTS